MSVNTIRYDAYGNKMQDKIGTNMKQTEEKTTNKRNNSISMAWECYWCQRKVNDYYYIIDKNDIPINYASALPTGIIRAKGVVCISCKVRCLLNSTFYGTIALMSKEGEIYLDE